MSCNEWERGEFKIPTAAWPSLKKDLRDAYNKTVSKDFLTAEALLAAVKLAVKGRRGVDLRKAVSDEAHATAPRPSYGYGSSGCTVDKYSFESKETYQVVDLLAIRDPETGKYKLSAPKKKDFVLATGKTMKFSAGGEGDISLQDQTKTLSWSVSENNHAVDRARESYMGAVLFKLLREVTWTRGSGGTIFGNDEYHADAAREYSGGGGSFDKEHFGPKASGALKLRLR